jgi:hypothetical protein
MANKGSPPKRAKVAMVAPVPVKPSALSNHPEVNSLVEALQLMGNDRPYTLIRSHGNSWKVHFLGDTLPTVIKIVNGKPVISKEE